jgi:hypothetical protein
MRFGVASLAFILSLAASSRAAPADDPTALDRLLAHVRTASGAPYAVHIVSEAHLTVDDRTYDLRIESDGYRSLTRRCRGDICQGEYFDGNRMFAVNLNDTALPSSLHANDEERASRAVATCAFAAPEFRTSGGTVTELPALSRSAKTYRRIAVRIGDAAFVVLIDPATWLPVETMTPDGRTSLELRDYRKVDGVMLPFEIRRDGTPIERFDTRRVSHEPLRAPRGLSPAFAETAAAVAMVRMPREPSNQPVVPCTLGGVAANCLIDTGNSSLGISLELAEKLGLEATGEYEISGVGRYVTGVVTAGPLLIGGATYPSARYVVLHDLHDYGYDVAIGADVLAHSRVTIDYPHRQVTFTNPARGTAPPIPLRFSNFLPIVGVQLGAIDVLLAIDTGDESSINVPYDFYADHPDLFEERGRSTVAGIGGTAQQVVGQIASARIGTFEVTNQRIGTTIAPEPAAGGHLGSGFFSHFTLTLDYEHSSFGLTPRPNDGAVRIGP